MKIHQPRISFIIPCYNASSYLYKCYTSLKMQTFDDIEFVFVNDGSSDDTKKIIEKILISDHRAVLVDQINLGITKARLNGIKCSRGEFISFVDSDDFIDETAAAEGLKILDCEHSIDAVLYSMSYIKNGTIRDFKNSISFPISGIEVWKLTIPSWRISTMGIYKREHALKAYSEIKLKTIDSNEVANRMIFQYCKNVKLIKSRYFYVDNESSITKTPSTYYISRLNTANWIRENANKKFNADITKIDLNIYYLNTLCDLMMLYKSKKQTMDLGVKNIWLKGFRYHRKNILRIWLFKNQGISLRNFITRKTMKKLLYVILFPLFDF